MTPKRNRWKGGLAALVAAWALTCTGCLKVLYYVEIDHYGRAKVTQVVKVERKVLMLEQSVPGAVRAEDILTRKRAEEHAKRMNARLLYFKVEKTNDGGLKSTAVYFCEHIRKLRLPMYPWPTPMRPCAWQKAFIRFQYADDEVLGVRRLWLYATRPDVKDRAARPPRRRTPAELQKFRKLLPIFRDMVKGFQLMLRIQICKKKQWMEQRYYPSDGQLTPIWLTDKDLLFDEDTLMYVVPWNIVGNEDRIRRLLENARYAISRHGDRPGWNLLSFRWKYFRHMGAWRYLGFDTDSGVTRLLPLSMTVPDVPMPPMPPPKRYEYKFIARDWRILELQKKSQIPADFMRPEFDDSKWKKTFVSRGAAVRTKPFLLYRKWIRVPARWKGRVVYLDFRGVRDRCIVYFNGREVHRNNGWNRRFTIDISKLARYGGKDLIVLFVENLTDRGGIWAPVYLGDTRYTSEFHLTREETLAEETPAQKALRAELPKLPGLIAFQMHKPGQVPLKENWDLYTIRPDGTGLRPLVRHPAADVRPKISPDGKTVLFLSLREHWDQILKMRKVPANVWEEYGVFYTVDIRGGNLRRLWPAKGRGSDACWAPDGRAIVFAQRQPARINILPLRVPNRPETGGRLISHPAPGVSQCTSPCLAPDGRLFFVDLPKGGGEDKYGRGRIAYLDPKTWQLVGRKWGQFGPRRMRWIDVSPDGKQQVYTMTDYFWKMNWSFLWDTITGPRPRFLGTDLGFKETRMMPGHANVFVRRMYNECPVWAPNSRYILFVRGPDHHEAVRLQFTRTAVLVDWMDLYLADPAGKRCVRLTWLRQRMGHPDWWAPNKR